MARVALFKPTTKFGAGSESRGDSRASRRRKKKQEKLNVTRKIPHRRMRRRNVGAPDVRRLTGGTAIPKTVAENVKGILDPHAPVRPKIMDTAVSESQTHPNRMVTTYNIGANQDAIFVLQPDISHPLIALNDPTNGAQLTVTGGLFTNFADFHWDVTNMPAGVGRGYITKQGDIDRWRLVSQGVKMQLLNTTDTNDGVFRCFRITSTCPVKDMGLIERAASTNEAYLRPTGNYLKFIYDQIASSAPERLSYHAGALKDIGSVRFQNQPLDDDHPFKLLRNDYEIRESDQYSPTGVKQWYVGADGVLGWSQLADATHDKTYDSVVILVTAGNSGSTLLIDCAQNLEVVYEQESQLARYHTPAVTHTTAQIAVHNQQQISPAAATPMTTT